MMIVLDTSDIYLLLWGFPLAIAVLGFASAFLMFFRLVMHMAMAR